MLYTKILLFLFLIILDGNVFIKGQENDTFTTETTGTTTTLRSLSTTGDTTASTTSGEATTLSSTSTSRGTTHTTQKASSDTTAGTTATTTTATTATTETTTTEATATGLDVNERLRPFWVSTIVTLSDANYANNATFLRMMETKLVNTYVIASQRSSTGTTGRRKRAATAGGYTVQIAATQTNPSQNSVALYYYVKRGDEILSASDVCNVLNNLNAQEMALQLNTPVSTVCSVADSTGEPQLIEKYWIIGAVFGALGSIALIIWLVLFVYSRCLKPYDSRPLVGKDEYFDENNEIIFSKQRLGSQPSVGDGESINQIASAVARRIEPKVSFMVEREVDEAVGYRYYHEFDDEYGRRPKKIRRRPMGTVSPEIDIEEQTASKRKKTSKSRGDDETEDYDDEIHQEKKKKKQKSNSKRQSKKRLDSDSDDEKKKKAKRKKKHSSDSSSSSSPSKSSSSSDDDSSDSSDDKKKKSPKKKKKGKSKKSKKKDDAENGHDTLLRELESVLEQENYSDKETKTNELEEDPGEVLHAISAEKDYSGYRPIQATSQIRQEAISARAVLHHPLFYNGDRVNELKADLPEVAPRKVDIPPLIIDSAENTPLNSSRETNSNRQRPLNRFILQPSPRVSSHSREPHALDSHRSPRESLPKNTDEIDLVSDINPSSSQDLVKAIRHEFQHT